MCMRDIWESIHAHLELNPSPKINETLQLMTSK